MPPLDVPEAGPVDQRMAVTARGESLGATLVTAGAGLVLCALPVFLLGGLAVQIRADLGFSETQLGAAVTIGFLAGALAGPLGGRVADRIGARAAIVTGAVLASIGLAGIGLLAADWATLTLFAGIGTLSFAFMDPGLAILISSSVDERRHGLAFGTKEASIPAATLTAGLAVPFIALTLGWRWALALGVIPLAILTVALPRVNQARPRIAGGRTGSAAAPPSRSALIQVSAAAACASTASSGIGVFLTESAVAMGFQPGPAGLLLATGSMAGIITRVATGVRADRTARPQLRTIATMIGLGAVAMALASLGSAPLLVLGAVGSFAGGWGWTGLLFLSLVRSSPSSPGAAAGIGLTGLGIGNALGPVAFGAVAEQFSFASAWLGAATLAAVGALIMRAAAPRFERGAASAPSRE